MLGMICRMDKTGLGNQTRNLAYMLKPQKIMLINSTKFNNNEQHPEWYDNFNVTIIDGFPNTAECNAFLYGIDRFISCEIPYNYYLFTEAKRRKIKSYLQYNFEFLDALQRRVPHPTHYIAPSLWRIHDTGLNPYHIPPPLFDNDFHIVRENNLSYHAKRFLHVVGKPAIHDRNGTGDLIAALKITKSDFSLTIKAQAMTDEIMQLSEDHRVIIDISNTDYEFDLYNGYDAMILPRRYGGLCLPMNEALMSALPVIMPDIDPNNTILPKKWLFEATQESTFLARTEIFVYKSVALSLANKIDWLCSVNIENEKLEAYQIAHENFSNSVLKEKYKLCLQ